MTWIHFSEVTLRGEKRGKCVSCGKRRKRVKRVFQTINPFNKGPDGLPKTRERILHELREELVRWQRKPIDCCGDEP